MSDSLTNAKQAALLLLLEEVQPLFDQLQQLSDEIKITHRSFSEDAQKIGQQVANHRQIVEKADAMFSAFQRLQTSGIKQVSVKATQENNFSIKKIILLSAISSLFATFLTAILFLLFFNSSLIEQARFGRAVAAVWQQLDTATQEKITRQRH